MEITQPMVGIIAAVAFVLWAACLVMLEREIR